MRKVKVGDIIRVSKGRKAAHVTNIKIENALRYIQIEDLRSDNILQYSLDKNGVFVDESDICIAWDGANAGTVGYGLSGIIGSTIARLRLEDKSIYTPYVGRFLQTKFHILNGKTTGTTIPHVERSRLDNLELSLPSFAEQRRIAAILDKADTIRRKRQEALKLADDLVKSRFIEMFGDPVTNPMGWEMPCLEKLAASSKNALKAGPFGSSLKKEDYTEKGYKIYGQEQVIKGDAFYGDYYISEQKYNTLKSCAVSEGDVLISLVGTYGKVLIVPHGFEPGIINPRLVKISFDKKKINTVFFEHFFASDSLKTKLDSNTNGCTMGVLNLGIIKKINIPLPPIALQNQFAAFVEQTDKSKFAMQRQLEEAEACKSALMQQFFN
ncbi:restriction endonuclease subunit S [uncultured Desulfovibrio sp.]|uniref:restriction endonuclease subunit S n=1 Tax=uncultured Desulfovibrio sp. TaxID=167968 RepID=UPI00258F9DCE|nr:restriction endonuclease subunit S [uncultured Desulfovibrio sp.]